MKVGLIDVDSHNFPNIPLMKISAWHKKQGDEVEFVNAFYKYDRIYQSKIFDFTPDYETVLKCDDIIKGGTGYGLDNKLPDEIENTYPNYNLYNIKDTAYGFLTRGCPRNCAFCIVGKKEGLKSYQVAELRQFWNGQKYIELCDPNLTACDNCVELMKELAKTTAWINFNQGIDIRFMTDEKAQLLNQIKIKRIHFAWDNYEFKTYEKLKEFRPKFKYRYEKLKVYVLTNFNTTMEQNLERIYKLKELDYDPYVMIFDKQNAPQKVRYLQRWVNNKVIFRTCEKFEDYNHKLG